MNQPITFIIALAVILALVVLILLLKRRREIEKHDNEVIRQYNKKMDEIRTERLKEAKRKLREAEKKKTYFTTYNDWESNPQKTQTKQRQDELAHYAKWYFDQKQRRERPRKYK